MMFQMGISFNLKCYLQQWNLQIVLVAPISKIPQLAKHQRLHPLGMQQRIDLTSVGQVFKKLMLRMMWMLKSVWKGHVKVLKTKEVWPTFQDSMQVPNSVSTVVRKHVCTHLEHRLTGKTKQCRQNVSVHCMFLPRLSQVWVLILTSYIGADNIIKLSTSQFITKSPNLSQNKFYQHPLPSNCFLRIHTAVFVELEQVA